MWRKSWCIIRPCEQGWCHSGKHIIHSQIPSCFMCLLRLLWDKLWFFSPPSHFLIGAQWVMTFWWLNMETGCKCLSLSSCWPQPVRLLSCWKEIQCTLFSAFCHSSHSISYFGLWQVPPPPSSPVFSPTAREPLALSPPVSLWRWRHILLVHQLFDRKTSHLRLTAPGIVGKRSCGREGAGARFPRKVGPAKNLCRCCECVMCASLLPWQW